MDNAIVVKNLSKIYRTNASKVYAVADVSFEIAQGEFCSITGKSGCGKSTLLTMLAGIERPTSGEIIVNGKPIHKYNEERLVNFRRDNIGFVFQSFHLFRYLTVEENIALPLVISGVSPAKRRKRVAEVIERMGLESHAGHTPDELSGGQQQRASIGRAIVSKPSILFADEPTGNLDSENAGQVNRLFHDINDEGTTVVMVTHDSGFAADASRTIRLSDGRII